MSYCQQCGEELDEEQDFCLECGADLTAEEDFEDESFINRYGAKPLPLASARGEFIRIYGSVMNAIPVFGSFMKLFVGLAWWFHSINLKILRLITMGADINDRFDADFIYLKDSFSSGYNDETAPPNPPE